MPIVDRETFFEGDLLISVVTKSNADAWGVDYPEGQFGPFGYWLQVYRELPADQSSFEPIAQFTSQEAAFDWATASKDDVTYWPEE